MPPDEAEIIACPQPPTTLPTIDELSERTASRSTMSRSTCSSSAVNRRRVAMSSPCTPSSKVCARACAGTPPRGLARWVQPGVAGKCFDLQSNKNLPPRNRRRRGSRTHRNPGRRFYSIERFSRTNPKTQRETHTREPAVPDGGALHRRQDLPAPRPARRCISSQRQYAGERRGRSSATCTRSREADCAIYGISATASNRTRTKAKMTFPSSCSPIPTSVRDVRR